jgi:hypothetical protein
VGDLEERYIFIHKNSSPGKANLWYWTQIVRSSGPIVWAATTASLKRAFDVGTMLELCKRLL